MVRCRHRHWARTLVQAGAVPALLCGPLLVQPAVAQDTTGAGAIVGVVRNAAGAPQEGVRVCVLDTSVCVESGPDGGFRVPDLRASSYRLQILTASGVPIVSEPVEVRAGLGGRVEVTLPDLLRVDAVTVTAPAFRMPEEVKSSGFLIEPREVLRSAGALQDVSRYVQSLPGVVIGTNDFRNDIIVRGGSPLENLFIVDNVEIPNINAFANFASAGGTVSLLDAQLIQDVTFLTGGYPAPYVNRTSSVLQIAQREGNRQEFRGWATVGFAGAGGVLEGPLDGGKGSWIVSARRSFLDIFTQDLGFGGVPVLYAFNGKAVYDLSARDRLWAVNLTGVDDIRLGLTEDASLDDEISNFDIRYRGWRTATGVNWQRVFGTRGVGLLGVTHSEAKVGSTVKDLVFGGVPSPDLPVDEIIATSPAVFRDDSREGETTLKYDLTLATRVAGKLQVGGSVKRFRLRYDTASPFGTDSPYAQQSGEGAFALDTAFTSWQTGLYLQASKAVTSRVDVTLGGRLDDYRYLDRTRFSPRASIAWRLRDGLTWTASAGRYVQQPFFLFLAAFPENRRLVPFRASHVVTGLAWQRDDGWRITVEAYRKAYRDYPVAADYPSLSLADIGDTFNVREILFPLVSAGTGTAQGIELFVERKLSARLYGQANLALSRTRHAGLDNVPRPGSFDSPVVANLIGGFRFSPRWEMSTRAAYLAGRPYTPFDTAASAAQRRGVYDLARLNAERAPAYFRLDVRLDRTFTVAGEPVTVFAGVQNVTNRKNFAGYQWNRRTDAVAFEDQQGLFPILGLEWRF